MSAIELVETEIDLENWIYGTSYMQAKVTIYRNPALLAEYEPLLERIENLEQASGKNDPEAGLTDASTSAELEELYAKADALAARFEADKEVWTVRALEPHEVTDLRDSIKRPTAPAPLPRDADDATREAHQAEKDEYNKAMEQWALGYNLSAIELAVLEVEVAGRKVPKPTGPMLSVLPKRPGGYRHVTQLGNAIMQASSQEPAILAPHR